jgi:hypothetical protein
VPAYFAGGLDREQSDHFELHVADCPVCSQLVDTVTESSDATLRALASLPISSDDEPELQLVYAQLMESSVAHLPGVEAAPGRRLADPPLGPLPQTLGKYELVECVGRGAWGAVYRARHTNLDQTVAVKVLDTSRWPGPQTVDRFAEEWRAMGKLCHPNIVRATDAGEDRGFYYLVMEFVDGLDAAKLLRQIGPLPVTDACEIVLQAALALQFAHEQSLVHRDVKPSNLLLTAGGTVKLADLGIAGHGDGRQFPDASQTPLGTADYMAPEQWTNFDGVDARADIYSLGMTLYKLLTDELPPTGPNEYAKRTLSLGQNRRDIRRNLARVIEKMLAADPSERQVSANDVVVALRPHTVGAQLQRLVDTARGRQPASHPAAGQRLRWTRRRALVATAVVGAGALWTPWLSGDRTPRLRRARWRPLAIDPAKIWLTVASRDEIQIRREESDQLRLDCQGMTLIDLGRPVSGRFALDVAFRQKDWQGEVGIFFCGLRGDDPVKTSRFQTLELRPPSDGTQRLLWSQWKVADVNGKLQAERTPLADVRVEVDRGRAQRLRAEFGRAGFPHVYWNGQKLDESRWEVSSEARRLASLPAPEAERYFLGRLGVFSTNEATVFSQPQLAYTA